MSTLHHWFRSGAYSLLGHITVPEPNRATRGVLIVPPFGWEDVCSYRPLRFMGQMLAAHGIPVMRFDLPGTGDSSGDARDSALFDAWVGSIGDAADGLRAATGVREVAVMGVRMGALLALLAAIRGVDLQDLILWSPYATGRAAVRELRAFSRLARSEYSNGAPSPPELIPGLEAGGFLLAPETQRELEAVDLSGLPEMPGRRVLILSRDDLPTDGHLVSALQSSGCAVEFGNGSDYTAMMAIPEDAQPPAAAARAVIDFLRRSPQHQPAPPNRSPIQASANVTTGGGTMFERIYSIERPPGSMFGILSTPGPQVEGPDWCVLFLNPGAVRHTGPNRMWVEAARRLAMRGVTSLRLDLQGIGESDGEPNLDVASLYRDRLVEQVELAMESLRTNLGIRRFAAVGLCSGAFWAFHAATRNRDVRGAILLNPRLFFWDPEVDRRRVLQRTARLLTETKDWYRLIRGYVSIDSVKRVSRILLDRLGTARSAGGPPLQIWSEGMAEAWKALDHNQSRLTLIFTEGEPLLREMEEEGHLPQETHSRVRCIRLANCGHTFRPLWAQKTAHELIDRELETIMNEAQAVEDTQDMAFQRKAAV